MGSTDHEKLKKRILEYLKENLKESRLQHTLRVAELAVSMADKEGIDPSKAELAALLHDCARNLPPEEMSRQIDRLKLPERYKGSVNLAHSKVGTAFAREMFAVEDEDILNAISYHTTGREAMSTLEKIVFLADAIEPERNYPGVERIRELAATSLDRACMESLGSTLAFLNSKGEFIDEDTVGAYEHIKERIE